MGFKKYKVADNAMAKLALPLTETTKTISIKDAINIPEGWERIATLAKVVGNEVIKMEKVIVKSRTENVLQVERGFESNPLQRETNDLLCLNVTAEVIRDLQNAVAEIDVNNKESISNKKETIEWNQTSNLFYPTVKAVWDWVTGLLNKKADLVNGKVPASQLPEVSQIDESNLVHKTWDETIGGIKKLTNIIKKSLNQKIDNYDEETAGVSYRQEWDEGYKRWLDFFAHWGQNQFVGGSGFRFLWNRPGSNALDVIMALVHWHLTFNWTITSQHFNTKQDGKTNRINIWKEWDLNRIDSYNDSSWFVDLNIRAKKLNFEWSSILSNGQDWTGEWQSYTPTLSGDSWGGATLSDRQWWYKIIGKTCFVMVRGIIGNKGNCWGKFKVSAPVRAKTRTSTPISGALQTIWWSIAQPKGIPLVSFDHIGLNGAWRWYRDIQRSEISVNDFFIFNGIYEIE